MICWYCCCKHFFKSFSWVGAFYQTGVRNIVCLFSYTNTSFIGKSIVYSNDSLFSTYPFLIQTLQLFSFNFYHYLICTNYFHFIIDNPPLFIFWPGLHNISTKPEGIKLRQSTSNKKIKVRGKHQNNNRRIQFAFRIKGNEPTIENRLFIITLYIYGTVTSQ